jgi:hypothetical protein
MTEIEGMPAILNGIKAAKSSVSLLVSCPRCRCPVSRLNWYGGSQMICTDLGACGWEGVRWGDVAN